MVEHIEKEEKETNAHTTPTQQNTPRSFANTTIAHSKFPMCIDAKFPHALICTPKFRNTPNSKVSDYLKRPSEFRNVYPKPPNWHFAVPKPSKSPFKFSKSNKTTPRVSLCSWGSGVSDNPTTQRTPTKHSHHTPEAFRGLWLPSKSAPFKGKFYTLGARSIHRPRHR